MSKVSWKHVHIYCITGRDIHWSCDQFTSSENSTLCLEYFLQVIKDEKQHSKRKQAITNVVLVNFAGQTFTRMHFSPINGNVSKLQVYCFKIFKTLLYLNYRQQWRDKVKEMHRLIVQ